MKNVITDSKSTGFNDHKDGTNRGMNK